MKKIFVIITLLNSVAWANDCGTVNQITALDSPFSKIPVYNQGKANICYAYSAAQIVDYHLIKQGAPKRSVHPLWVALNFALSTNRQVLEIGHTKEAIAGLLQKSNCDYETVARAMESVSDSLPMIELAKHLSAACEESMRIQVNLPMAMKYDYRQLPDDNSYSEFLKRKLNESDSPLAISYCANIWRDQDYVGIQLNRNKVRDQLKAGCHYHESLVVGKKELAGQCHFLVRNTWGSHWSKFNSSWACVCRNKITGIYVDDCSAKIHSNDEYEVEGCWLPAEKLKRNIGKITFLELNEPKILP